VRLLLDAHVSGPTMGRRLTASGHDVRALDQEPALERLDDDDVRALAAGERRILVTHNVADFPRIVRDSAASGRARRRHTRLRHRPQRVRPHRARHPAVARAAPRPGGLDRLPGNRRPTFAGR
jgi:hypothetical protein